MQKTQEKLAKVLDKFSDFLDEEMPSKPKVKWYTRYVKKIPYLYRSATNRMIALLTTVGVYKDSITETVVSHSSLLENDVNLGISLMMVVAGVKASKGYIDSPYKKPIEDRYNEEEEDEFIGDI